MLGRSSGNHDWLLANAIACVSCGFRLRNAATHATQAIAFEWKPGLTLTLTIVVPVMFFSSFFSNYTAFKIFFN